MYELIIRLNSTSVVVVEAVILDDVLYIIIIDPILVIVHDIFVKVNLVVFLQFVLKIS